jgi:hypothetical protein
MRTDETRSKCITPTSRLHHRGAMLHGVVDGLA